MILSVNPNLTQKEVTYIIEQTAQKVGGYNYITTSGRVNGIWHNEMGYGLIDAYEAVKKTMNCTSTTLTGVQPTKRVVCEEINVEDATVPAGVTLELKATKRVTINPGFKVEANSKFIIE